ncbi:MAG: acetyl-CoA C-acyltransferase [Gammaproteobacteria bacterium]|nr:acetyl-CoA C-acyltransferase [Gammaproteobacteria bacterium]MDE0247755.1 acetyl-CoA C-acyltransferase [Gammaproteobacteria bacterium]
MRAAVVTGCRTPFAKSGGDFRDLSAVDLGKIAVREALARSELPGRAVDQLVFGTVVHDPSAPNIAREVGLGVLAEGVPAHTVSLACASANRAIADGASLIETGQADVVIAGGAESLTRIPFTLSDRLASILVASSKARSLRKRAGILSRIRPRDLLPVHPQIAEPSTGETMGAAAERMAKENGIAREAQDAWALRSHRLAAAGTEDGRLTAEMAPVFLAPSYKKIIDRDAGIRRDTSLEAMAALDPVFDPRHGSVTAANSSPLTDGAAAVVLMSEDALVKHDARPLAWIRAHAVSALDPAGQLLQGPAYAVPAALDRAGLTMGDVDLMEMHEAFSAQVLSNLQALDSQAFARNELGRSRAVGHPPEDRINVMGGSIALGHPFGATGARITLTLANELRRRDGHFGLLTVCAAGGMGFAMVLERA